MVAHSVEVMWPWLLLIVIVFEALLQRKEIVKAIRRRLR